MLVPPVRRNGVERADLVHVAAFALGGLVGGLATLGSLWILSGLVSWLPSLIRVGLLAAVALAILLRALGPLSFRLPGETLRWLIPPSRFEHSTTQGIFVFGLELGLMFRTYVPRPGPYLLATYVLLVVPSPAAVAGMALAWSMARSLPLLYRALRATTVGDRVALYDQGAAESDRMDAGINRMAALASHGLSVSVLVGSVSVIGFVITA